MPANTRREHQQRLERNLKIASAIIGGLGLTALVATLNTIGLGVLLLGVGGITVITFPEETQEWVKWVEKNPFIIGAAALGATFNMPAALLFAATAYCAKLYFNKGISALHQAKEQAQERVGPVLSILSWATNAIARSLSPHEVNEVNEVNEEAETQASEIENIEGSEIQFFEFEPENIIEPFTPLRIAAANSSRSDELANRSIGIPMSQEDFERCLRL